MKPDSVLMNLSKLPCFVTVQIQTNPVKVLENDPAEKGKFYLGQSEQVKGRMNRLRSFSSWPVVNLLEDRTDRWVRPNLHLKGRERRGVGVARTCRLPARRVARSTT